MSFQVTGKFFTKDGERFELRGTTFGPFPPNAGGLGLPEREAIPDELQRIATAGLNLIRLYEPPPRWFLDQCQEAGLAVLVGIPWTQHVDFLADKQAGQQAREVVRETVRELGDHPAVFAFLVGNEVEGGLVRWMGPARVRKFLEELITEARSVCPGVLLSYASYPTTEYLFPRNADFVAFNVYLEEEESFRRYLRRLQLLAGDKPLVLAEFGVDTKHHGESFQSATLPWSIRTARECGAAGHVLFAWSDLWHRGGKEVVDWDFGLTDRNGAAKPALAEVSRAWDEELDAGEGLTFSVVVCTYNGTATLARCLDSLADLEPAPLEVLVVDDGSTRDIASIVSGRERVRYVRIERNGGLSAARNRGAEEARGDVVAYIDDDAFAFPDWLAHLALAFRDPSCAAAGGPNVPPPDSSLTGRVLAAVPGRPAHVMIDDLRAEHLPGCNLAVRRADWDEVGGFDPRFRAAGDDVDFCWRLLDAGREVHFAPGAVVWHLPRGTIRGYLRQQGGYGKAEALLLDKHAHRFIDGQIAWRGVVYAGTARLSGAMVYFGRFGSAPFQGIVYGPRHPFPGFGATRGPVAFFARTLGRLGAAARAWKRSLGGLRARRPHSQRELSFWSEQNVGREEFITVLCELASADGWRLESGDGWQRWDLRMTHLSKEEVTVSAVSEYHGGNEVKTRVRLEGAGPSGGEPLALATAKTLGLKPMPS